MPSTFTTSLRIEKQGAGENRTSWGSRANRSFVRVEEGITGHADILMPNDNVTLTTESGTPDDARMRTLSIGGSNTAARTVTIPNVAKIYDIINQTSGGFDVTISNGISQAVIESGELISLVTNGSTFWTDSPMPPYVIVPTNSSPIYISGGYQKFSNTPGGLMMQWMRLKPVTVGTVTVPWPTPFGTLNGLTGGGTWVSGAWASVAPNGTPTALSLTINTLYDPPAGQTGIDGAVIVPTGGTDFSVFHIGTAP